MKKPKKVVKIKTLSKDGKPKAMAVSVTKKKPKGPY